MKRYEYQLVRTPSKSIKFDGLKKSDDAFGLTLMASMNELARAGWQFVRNETLVEERRRFFGKAIQQQHDYMVYSREMRSDVLELRSPVAPKRIKRVQNISTDELRARVPEQAEPQSQPPALVALQS